MSPVRYKDVQRDKLREIILSPSEGNVGETVWKKGKPKSQHHGKEREKNGGKTGTWRLETGCLRQPEEESVSTYIDVEVGNSITNICTNMNHFLLYICLGNELQTMCLLKVFFGCVTDKTDNLSH